MEKIDKKAVIDTINGYMVDKLDIGYLTEAINALPITTDEWVSVSERLPDNGTWVLCYTEWQKESKRDFSVSIDMFDGETWQGYSNHTHWQPLPQPPIK